MTARALLFGGRLDGLVYPVPIDAHGYPMRTLLGPGEPMAKPVDGTKPVSILRYYRTRKLREEPAGELWLYVLEGVVRFKPAGPGWTLDSWSAGRRGFCIEGSPSACYARHRLGA